MYCYAIFVAWCCLMPVQAVKDSPRIIIVGGGAAGIAAATRLYENGFNRITIIEAENRIGGRIYTTPFGGYGVDLGAQWVFGDKDNVVYDLAWPLGVLAHSISPKGSQIIDSSGTPLSKDLSNKVFQFYVKLVTDKIPDSYLNKSQGEYFQPKVDEFLNAQSGLTPGQRKSLGYMMNLFQMGWKNADSWFNVSINNESVPPKGDLGITWKDKGFNMILDIMMKKYPDPTKELPVLNNTILNTEVLRINYNDSCGSIRIATSRGNEYFAEHVIVTQSLAVLKADYKTLFNPPLPKAKINAIKGIEFGNMVKIFLTYPKPWWPLGNGSLPMVYDFFWTQKDKVEYANNPEKSWMLGIIYIYGVDHKPGLLSLWVMGSHAREMENIPDARVFQQTKEFLHKFMGKTQNLTEPSKMIRSKWLGNRHFRGTWSYRSPKTERLGAKAGHLASPIIRNDIPRVLFAGEATDSKYPSTVNGAISTGWREADRLIKLYPK